MTASGLVLSGDVVAKINDGACCDWCRQPVHVEQSVVALCCYSPASFVVVHRRPTDVCWNELVDDLFKKAGERWK